MAGGTRRGGASVQCRDRRPETLSWTAGASAATELMEAREPGLVPAVYEHADTEAQCGNASRLGDVEPDSDTNCANDDEEQDLSARAIDGLRATSSAALQRSSAPAASTPAGREACTLHPPHAQKPPPFHTPERLAERATHAESDCEQHRRKSSPLPPRMHRARSAHDICNAPAASPVPRAQCRPRIRGSTTLSSPLTAAPCVACDRRAASRKSTVVLRHLHAAPDLRAGATPSNPRCRATSAGPSPDVSSLGTRSQHVPLATSRQDFPRKLCSCGRRRDAPHSSGAF
ncbi:hypothetical protein B0H15DRAFT_950339 [Mycena belliarum]|uniref:Uncharacterized protein n=1 Tax=Mycena belliarum TaxID=1033014 RepID=A0AAD6XTS3_9AGAR|nr:hypothetical protein B0H15DRAFT_950339 [Mycena belliae]